MGFEFMGEDIVPCRCNNGTVITAMFMDDWNRVKYQKRTSCATCQMEDERVAAEYAAEKRKSVACLEKARTLATERYLKGWLQSFANCSIKAAWMRYTKSSGYPKLNTFYQHVQHAGGLMKYLEWSFGNDIQHHWRRYGIIDEEIEALLARANDPWM